MSKIISFNQKNGQEINEGDKEVASFIVQNLNQDYDRNLEGASWNVFFNCSSFREGILNWYPFIRDSHILHVCNDFGSITGLLSRVAEEVTVLSNNCVKAEHIAKRYFDKDNVTVITEYGSTLKLDMIYDYIVIDEEFYTEHRIENVLKQIWPFLKETGRVLFVCDNRFGMKYWCGVPDAVTNMPFYGIRGKAKKGTVNRQELIHFLMDSEFIKGWQLYYPFPDYKLPQSIYTDAGLPHESFRDRVIPYYTEEQQKTLICLESEICDDIIYNGVLNVFANSFLVECGKLHFEAIVNQVALSTDRGKERGFATVITSNDLVKKIALYPEGIPSLEKLHKNCEDLVRHGIECVEEKIMSGFIEMPYIHHKTLIEHIRYLFLHDYNQVDYIFDKLYSAILSSSEQVEFNKCRLKDDRITENNVGKVLEKAYIDMIPYNSFYIDDKIVFFDQEFVKECYPAKYVLFRALRYTYIYVSEAEDIIPIIYFKKKYDLVQLWQVFEEEEVRFVEENRNYRELSSFYKWASVSPSKPDENIERLLHEDVKEITVITQKKRIPLCRHRYDIDMYNEDEKLNAVKKVQLNLLKKYIEVCEKNKLAYCVFYGTLLGTIRHKGFVPWDDDIDVVMPRKDYDKLINIADKVFAYPFFLQTPENDCGCFYGGYSKLRDSSTTGMEERNRGHECNQGIWLDIMPLDIVTKNEELYKAQQSKITFYQRLLLKKTYPDKRMLWEMDEQKEKYFEETSRLFSREDLCEKLQQAITFGWSLETMNEESKLAVLARYYGEKSCPMYDVSDFAYVVKKRFENLEVLVPIGYQHYLKKEYGDDYRIYPEEENRKPHHTAEFDVSKSYTETLEMILKEGK